MSNPASSDHWVVDSVDQLDELYGDPPSTALTKEVGYITELHRRFIDASPFVVIATSGPEGLDCSPRGDPAGLVRVVGSNTVLMPDRRGNNRLDSLRNIVRDPRVALLFLVPGIGVTLRINGSARILSDPDLRASFTIDDKLPATVIEITAERVYTQCPKALLRSRFWDPEQHRTHDDVPTVGQIMEQITAGGIDGTSYDAEYPERLRTSMY